MSDTIEHSGIVFDIVGTRVDVAIEAGSACAACRVKNVCGMGEKTEKLISVIVPEPHVFSIGEQVRVSVEKAMGIKAVVLAYIIPFVLIFTALLIMIELGVGEVTAGLSAIGIGVAWYVVLFFLRDRINKEIIFKISKYDE